MTARKLVLNASIGVFVLGAAIAPVILWRASSVPDPATGRTEPFIFAPEISPAPSYITALDGWLIAGCNGAALALFVAWLAMEARHRLGFGG
jgi:hypothetical protein